jgi:hypothetical protein
MTALAPRVDSTGARDPAPFEHPLHLRSSALTRRWDQSRGIRAVRDEGEQLARHAIGRLIRLSRDR